MKTFKFLLLAFALMKGLTLYSQPAKIEKNPVLIIFDTDIGPDYDDVGAIAVLHALADKGEAEILATVASNKYEGIASILNIFNTYYGRPNIPIGVPTGDAVKSKDSQGWTDALRSKYPHKIKKNAQAADAVELYRKILSQQPDTSVTIVTVGFLTNMANLLNSEPDKYSKLKGTDLVKQKVKKLVSMAGKFPKGREFNVYRDAKSSKEAFDKWPTPIILSGHEIGSAIKTGLPLIHNDSIQNSPVKDTYKISIPKSSEDKDGRMSWDQTAVLVAVRGASDYYELVKGRIVTEADGFNTWDATGKGHYYLQVKMPVKEVNLLIDELMQHQPLIKE